MPSRPTFDAQQLDLLGGAPSTPAEVHRLFFALMPDEVTRNSLSCTADALKAGHATLRTRWITPARYHATVHFLGDHPMLRQDVIQGAKAAGDALVAVAFDWSLDLASTFRGREPPLILRGSVVPDALQQLWQNLRERLIRAGQGAQMERTFTPHVTLGYSRGGMLEPMPIEPVHWRVERLALIHSVVGQKDYEVLHRWDLAE